MVRHVVYRQVFPDEIPLGTLCRTCGATSVEGRGSSYPLPVAGWTASQPAHRATMACRKCMLCRAARRKRTDRLFGPLVI